MRTRSENNSCLQKLQDFQTIPFIESLKKMYDLRDELNEPSPLVLILDSERENMDYAVTSGAHQLWDSHNCLEVKSSPSATHRQQMMDLAETFKISKKYMKKSSKNTHLIPEPTDRLFNSLKNILVAEGFSSQSTQFTIKAIMSNSVAALKGLGNEV